MKSQYFDDVIYHQQKVVHAFFRRNERSELYKTMYPMSARYRDASVSRYRTEPVVIETLRRTRLDAIVRPAWANITMLRTSPCCEYHHVANSTMLRTSPCCEHHHGLGTISCRHGNILFYMVLYIGHRHRYT